MKAKGDRSKSVGSSKRVKGPAATKKSMATKPKGNPVVMPGGSAAYHHRGGKG